MQDRATIASQWNDQAPKNKIQINHNDQYSKEFLILILIFVDWNLFEIYRLVFGISTAVQWLENRKDHFGNKVTR